MDRPSIEQQFGAQGSFLIDFYLNRTRLLLAGDACQSSPVGGRFTGTHRTWLDPSGAARAPVVRRARLWEPCSAATHGTCVYWHGTLLLVPKFRWASVLKRMDTFEVILRGEADRVHLVLVAQATFETAG